MKISIPLRITEILNKDFAEYELEMLMSILRFRMKFLCRFLSSLNFSFLCLYLQVINLSLFRLESSVCDASVLFHGMTSANIFR